MLLREKWAQTEVAGGAGDMESRGDLDRGQLSRAAQAGTLGVSGSEFKSYPAAGA